MFCGSRLVLTKLLLQIVGFQYLQHAPVVARSILISCQTLSCSALPVGHALCLPAYRFVLFRYSLVAAVTIASVALACYRVLSHCHSFIVIHSMPLAMLKKLFSCCDNAMYWPLILHNAIKTHVGTLKGLELALEDQ
jgi:hypothetical protein